MRASLSSPLAEQLFHEHHRFLWRLCYRLTGSAADADDIVQDTFIRALEHPPIRTDEPWRPWLVRVAMNRGRDILRRRRRRTYTGPWLPSPLETGDEASPPSYEAIADDQLSTDGRYDLVESLSLAFLLALEALTPQQRAVLLLRDVVEYSVEETAAALAMSVANVKTTHHRARRAMASYDRARCLPTRSLQDRTRQVLERFLACLSSRDVTGLESLLATDVQLVSDGGGEFRAALKVIQSRDKIVRFFAKTLEHNRPIAHVTMQMLNGLPALVIEYADQQERQASRLVQYIEIDSDNRIHTLHTVLASRKLTAVQFAQHLFSAG
jgi:RNA polymerase sigma-70 factor (ECF subfamily)